MTTFDLSLFDAAIGEILTAALNAGGEALVDQAMTQLGVAERHLARIRAGQLELTEGVEREIADSFERARTLVAEHRR